jgi:hypothetical protein
MSVHDDADALADEVKGDLREFADSREIRHTTGEDGFVERVLETRLEHGVSGGQLLHVGRAWASGQRNGEQKKGP